MGKIHDRLKNNSLRQSSVAIASVGRIAPRREHHSALEDWQIHEAFHKQKYIVVEHPDLGEVALNFPNFLVHSEMASRVFYGLRVISAGFFALYPNGEARVYGRSESLDLDSRPEHDPALIERTLGLS